MRGLDPDYDKRRFGTSQAGLAAVVRAKAHDDWARSFLAEHPDAVVLHLGCGLDARVYRLDPPATVEWYDLDYPSTIELRQRFLPPREHYHLIGSSVTDLAWLDRIPRGRPVLMIAEGLVPYLIEADVRRLLTSVVDAFPAGQVQLRHGVGSWVANVEVGSHVAQVRRAVPLRLRRSGRAGRLASAAGVRRRGADERLTDPDGQGAREHTPDVSPPQPAARHETGQSASFASASESATVVLRAEPGADVGALVVRGPAGIGKSALCRQIAYLARAQRSTVITVAGQADTPYAPLARAVEQLVLSGRTVLDGVGARARSVLAELMALATTAESLERSLSRHEVIGAIRRLLLAGARRAGVVLIVDDADVADETTIDALLELSAAGGTPLVVVLSYRPEAAPVLLREGVARLARAGRAVEIDLDPLDRPDAVALVTAAAPGTPDPAVIERVLELGEGNPFFTLELARAAGAHPPVAIPATLAEAVTSRFVDLNEGSAAMLKRLALVGDDLDATSVMALTGSSEADAFALLDAALRAGVLVVSGAGYKFRHELVRQALAARVAPHERIAVHRDAARRLADAGAPPGLIARHWLDGERPTEARDWLIAAAREAIRLGAFAAAVGHLAAVLQHEPDHADALRLRGEALDALGDVGAPAAYAAAAHVARQPEAHELRAKQALAQLKGGDPPGALETLEGVEPTTLEGRLAQALTLAAAAALGFSDPELGGAKAAESRRLALRSGDPGSVLVASWAQAAAAHARGQLRHSVLVDLRETSELPDLALSVFDGQLCITQRLLYGAAPYPDVIAWADALAAEAKRLDAARGHAFAITLRGEAKLLSGRLDEADDDLAEGARLHQAIGAATGESLSLERRAEVAVYRGRPIEAAALLDDALAVARESDAGFHLFDRVYGARILAAPDPQAALAAVEEAEAAVRGPAETCPGCRITLAVPAAIAAARARDPDRTTRWAKESEMLACVVMRLPAWDAALEEVKGHQAQAGEDPVAAAWRFRAAAERFADAGQPLDQARCAALAAAAV